MKRTGFILSLIISICVAQTKRPITFDDLMGWGRVSDPQVAPDGRWVAFVVTTPNKPENKNGSNIVLVSSDGKETRQLTDAKGHNNNPRWMPDGKSLVFLSTREGEPQIWSVPAAGGEAKKIFSFATGVSGLTISPDGKWFAFNSEVYPDCPDENCNKLREESAENSKVKAKIFERLPYRVWNAWKDGKRSHVFVVPAEGGRAIDLTPGDFDSPPIDLGGNWDYTFSPDSKEVAFVRNFEPNIAWSTNNDIFVVPITGGTAKKITESPGNDGQPLYSPDGKYIAFFNMKRPGFEADAKTLMLYERPTGSIVRLTEDFDLSVNDVVWSRDSKTIYFNAEEKSNESIFRVTIATKKIEKLAGEGYNHSVRLSADGKALVFLKETINKPAEVYRMGADGKNPQQLSVVNDAKLSSLDLSPKEDFWFEGAGGTKVHGFFVKPPAFDATKKYPVVLLIHGGPQGQWGNSITYRWNAQMFASRGYVVVLINPRGSTGYGQQFTDGISGDWGGKVYEDLMNGLDYFLKTYSFSDANRVAAAGASYGGYLVNWIAGHTNRFKTLVSHDGMFNPWSAFGTTEELWFNEWEFGGTPYANPELFNKWSPLAFASKMKTPMLVIHSQLDYRLDVSEGYQLFTALQRQGVKSKMLYFPDEGHWVLKPQNSELWYKTVLDWIDENTK
jgi:dipeptidyl aminopeptidase/acylaminoacyl peptidase